MIPVTPLGHSISGLDRPLAIHSVGHGDKQKSSVMCRTNFFTAGDIPRTTQDPRFKLTHLDTILRVELAFFGRLTDVHSLQRRREP